MEESTTLTPICRAVSTLAQPWPYVSCMCAAKALNGTVSEQACTVKIRAEPQDFPDLQALDNLAVPICNSGSLMLFPPSCQACASPETWLQWMQVSPRHWCPPLTPQSIPNHEAWLQHQLLQQEPPFPAWVQLGPSLCIQRTPSLNMWTTSK